MLDLSGSSALPCGAGGVGLQALSGNFYSYLVLALTKAETVRLFGQTEKTKDLEELKHSIEAFLPVVRDTVELQQAAEAYRACLEEAERLLSEGFRQKDLSELAGAVPKLFWLHKEWVPPLVQTADGKWEEPEWFKRAERFHHRVIKAASQLRVVGTY